MRGLPRPEHQYHNRVRGADTLGLCLAVRLTLEGLQAKLWAPGHLSGCWFGAWDMLSFSDHKGLEFRVCVCKLLVKSLAQLGPVILHHIVFFGKCLYI